ncbi:MAG TPA: hypothetical protein VFY56_09065 [Propionibacteriaceae bacterium]|nr:hypothetical protein [Propionibacteriaceae bacterium]
MTVAQPIGIRPAARSARSVGKMRIGRQLPGAVRRDLAQLVPHSPIAEMLEEGRRVRRGSVAPENEMLPSLGPELFHPASALGIGDRLVGAVATDASGVGE